MISHFLIKQNLTDLVKKKRFLSQFTNYKRFKIP